MSELVPAKPAPLATRVALADDAPSLEELFRFSREAELRVQSLRMDIRQHATNARGEVTVTHEVVLRHPRQARVTTRRSDDPLSRDYEVWITDGQAAHTYKAATNVASRRPLHSGVIGRHDTGLPRFAQQLEARFRLPSGTLADTFVHPHGLYRNVLVTGPVAIIGTQLIHGREAFVVRADHPRTAKVLVDRPDRSIEVGIDRATGFLLSLTETVADEITHRAEVIALAIDPVVHDSTFELRLPSDVRMLY